MLIEYERNLPLIESEVTRLLRLSLQEILHSGTDIIRFTGDDLPAGVVRDNVYDHTLRCFALVDTLRIFPYEFKQKLKRMMLLHDLPEVKNLRRMHRSSDMTAPEKLANPQLAEHITKMEAATALEIFTPEEYNLYRKFELGAHDLKEGRVNSQTPALGVLAKVIDVVDADLTLHRSLTRWALTADYQRDLIKPHNSLDYAFHHGIVMMANVNHLTDPSLRMTALDLLNNHLNTISYMWRLIFEAGRPLPEEIEEFAGENNYVRQFLREITP